MTNLRHLHVHTEYSLLDGFCKINKLINRLKELEMDSVAITDHGAMYGIIDFYQECKKNGIKPIIGFEAYVVQDIRDPSLANEINNITEIYNILYENKKKIEDEDIKKFLSKKLSPTAVKKLAIEDTIKHNTTYFGNSVVETETIETEIETESGTEVMSETMFKYKLAQSHLLLLAKDQDGYKNLLKLASIAQIEGFYKKPLLDFDTLKKYGKGIIATSACRAGEIPRMILRGRVDLATELAKRYSEIFDEFYLEVQPSELAEQLMINDTLASISEKTGIPLVATSDAHYVRKEDFHLHDILLAVSTGKDFDDENRLRFEENVNYIMTEDEMLSFGIPQVAIDNTKVIADKCNVEIELGKMNFPYIDIPSGYTPRQYIDKLCINGFYKRYNSWDEDKKSSIDINEYMERIEYELNVIEQKGLIDYFLIVRDFIRYAKENNIYVGPGRGSAAGSMVSYCLEITNLDPIQYNLLFSRFLNPERMSMPDYYIA